MERIYETPKPLNSDFSAFEWYETKAQSGFGGDLLSRPDKGHKPFTQNQLTSGLNIHIRKIDCIREAEADDNGDCVTPNLHRIPSLATFSSGTYSAGHPYLAAQRIRCSPDHLHAVK